MVYWKSVILLPFCLLLVTNAPVAAAEDLPPVVTRIYEVGDLVTPPLKGDGRLWDVWRTRPASRPVLPFAGFQQGLPHPPPTAAQLVEDLTRLIIETVAPEKWIVSGGDEAQLKYEDGRLLVKATQKMQAEIVKLLGQLREQRALFVHVEAKLLVADADLLKRWKIEIEPRTRLHSQGGALLSDRQVEDLMRTAKETNARVLVPPAFDIEDFGSAFTAVHLPRRYVTRYDKIKDNTRVAGGAGFAALTSIVEPGLLLSAKTVINADHKGVCLSLDAVYTELERFERTPFAADPSLVIESPRLAHYTMEQFFACIDDKQTVLVQAFEQAKEGPVATQPATGPATQPAFEPRLLLLVKPTIMERRPATTRELHR